MPFYRDNIDPDLPKWQPWVVSFFEIIHCQICVCYIHSFGVPKITSRNYGLFLIPPPASLIVTVLSNKA